MKKLIITLAALMVSVAAYGQGQFVFNNRIVPDVVARFVQPGDAEGTSTVTGAEWSVQLLGGPTGTAVGSMQPLTPGTTGFRTGNAAGFVQQIDPVVPGVPAGTSADVIVRVLGPGGVSVDFGPFATGPLGGIGPQGPVIPPNLPLGTAPLIVPEPATWALGALGLAALLAIRRRK
jgi:MYXO-CTERM domain-containing protein